jgi:uncharacterized protein YgfB (UPF0149 family)
MKQGKTKKGATLPPFNKLNKVLNATTLKLHPSQVHGLVCGMLCAHPLSDPQNNTSAWEAVVTNGESSDKAHAVLHALYEASAKQLHEFLFEFQLILPADEEPLPVRAEALTLWCQGALTGLKLAQVPIEDREAGEVTEAINDLIEIAKMHYEDVVASEEDEAAYVELVEYVRVAVMLIYQNMHEEDTVTLSPSFNEQVH